MPLLMSHLSALRFRQFGQFVGQCVLNFNLVIKSKVIVALISHLDLRQMIKFVNSQSLVVEVMMIWFGGMRSL